MMIRTIISKRSDSVKKIIFLFCLCIALVPFNVKASDVIDCGDVSFEIHQRDGNVVITKRGENPFMKVYSYEGHTVTVTDVTCYKNIYTFYGYSHGSSRENYYDTLVFVMDEFGNVVFEDISDFGGNEETIGADWIDQVLFLIIRVDTLGDSNNDYEFEFDYQLILTYDANYNQLDSMTLDNQILTYDFTEDMLLLSYTYQGPVDLGLDTQMNRYLNNDVFDVKGTYEGSMELSFINQGILNGETMENGFDIDYPGVYLFNYNDLEYAFIVHPIVDGVEHLETYNSSVTPLISNGNISLNNELYISGTEISNPGNYTMTVTGINGYEQTIQFTITPQVDGVINGHDYNEPFVITFDGEGYLNNSLVTSPLQIKEDGDYILRINGVGGYSDLYQFTFMEEHSSITTSDVIQRIDIFIVVVAIVIGVVIIKKK